MQFFRKNILLATALTTVLAISGGATVAHAAGAVAAPLVTPAWLSGHLNDHNLVIVEVYDHDAQAPAYQAEHIPGSVFTGFLDDKWRVAVNGVPAQLPPEDQLAKLIGSFGIGNSSRVVLVPGGAKMGDFQAVTRIYWELRVEGQNNVSILNGGDVAWLSDPKNPVATGTETPQPAAFVPHFNSALIATLPLMKSNLDTNAYQLVDARPPGQFTGKVLPAVNKRAGTVPGAINLPYSTLFTADNEGVQDPTALEATLEKAGVQRDRKTITFCNTGHLASSDWFVLHEVLNMPNVRLYAASMTEWSRTADMPMVPGKPAM